MGCGTCGGKAQPSSTRTLTSASGRSKTTVFEVKFTDGRVKQYTTKIEAEAAKAKYGGTLTTKTK